jgi:hypothetical protein
MLGHRRFVRGDYAGHQHQNRRHHLLARGLCQASTRSLRQAKRRPRSMIFSLTKKRHSTTSRVILASSISTGAANFGWGMADSFRWARSNLRSRRAPPSRLITQKLVSRSSGALLALKLGRGRSGSYRKDFSERSPAKAGSASCPIACASGYAASGRDIQRMSGIAGNTQPRPATT